MTLHVDRQTLSTNVTCGELATLAWLVSSFVWCANVSHRVPADVPGDEGGPRKAPASELLFNHVEVRMRTHLIIVALMLGAIACADRTAPISGPPTSRLFTGSTPEPTEYPAERAFWELARVAPSHGGLYFDTLTGDLNVYLKDMTEGPAAKRALPIVFSEGLASARARHPQAGIVFKQGTYTFIELARWRDALDSVLMATPSVQWWGVDHAKNQIVVGVLSGADSEAIVAMALELAIPAGALRFEKTGRVHPEQTLLDSIRPVKGGIVLEHKKSPTSPIYQCTLGFLALWGGEHAFVTASHCSSQRGALDSTKQYQPHLASNDSSIGFEVADFSYTCHTVLTCSNADAAVYRATLGPGDWYFKRVARTVGGCFPSCTPPAPLTIDSTRPFWSIVRTRTTIAVGDLVSKIGIATGWSQSYVRQVCMTVKSNVSYFCQAYSDYQQDDGDSGSTSASGYPWGNGHYSHARRDSLGKYHRWPL